MLTRFKINGTKPGHGHPSAVLLAIKVLIFSFFLSIPFSAFAAPSSEKSTFLQYCANSIFPFLNLNPTTLRADLDGGVFNFYHSPKLTKEFFKADLENICNPKRYTNYMGDDVGIGKVLDYLWSVHRNNLSPESTAELIDRGSSVSETAWKSFVIQEANQREISLAPLKDRIAGQLKKASSEGNSSASTHLADLYRRGMFGSEGRIREYPIYLDRAKNQGSVSVRIHSLIESIVTIEDLSSEDRAAFDSLLVNYQDIKDPLLKSYVLNSLCFNAWFDFERNDEFCAYAAAISDPVYLLDKTKNRLSNPWVVGNVPTDFETNLISKETLIASVEDLMIVIESAEQGLFEDRYNRNHASNLYDMAHVSQAIVLLSQLSALLYMVPKEVGDEYVWDGRKGLISEDVENRVVKSLFPVAVKSGRVAVGYALGIISNLDLFERLDEKTKKQASLFNSLNTRMDGNQDSCARLSSQQFSKIPGWPDDLPILMGLLPGWFDIFDAESLNSQKITLEFSGTLRFFDPSYLNLARWSGSDECYHSLRSGTDFHFPKLPIKEYGEASYLPLSFPSDINFSSFVSKFELTDSELSSTSGGVVEWWFRGDQEIRFSADLEQFPFEVHPVKMALNFFFQSDNVVLLPLSEDWRGLVNTSSRLPDVLTDASFFAGSFDAPNIWRWPGVQELEFYFDLDENYNFYVYKLIIPTCLFVLISLVTLLRPNRDSEAHLQVATTVMVALVAYQFIVNDDIPKLRYLTLLDLFLLFMLVSTAITIIANLLPHLAATQKIHFQTRLYNAARLGALISFVIGIATLVYGLYLALQT